MRAKPIAMVATVAWGTTVQEVALDPTGSVALFWGDQAVDQIVGGYYARHPRMLSQAELRDNLGAEARALFSDPNHPIVTDEVIRTLWSSHRAPSGYLHPWIWKSGVCPPKVDLNLVLGDGPMDERPRLASLEMTCESKGELRKARLDAHACTGLIWDDLGARMLGEFYDAHPRHLSPEEALINLGENAPRFFEDPTRLVVTGRVIDRLWAHQDEMGYEVPWIWKTGTCPPMMGSTWSEMETVSSRASVQAG